MFNIVFIRMKNMERAFIYELDQTLSVPSRLSIDGWVKI